MAQQDNTIRSVNQHEKTRKESFLEENNKIFNSVSVDAWKIYVKEETSYDIYQLCAIQVYRKKKGLKIDGWSFRFVQVRFYVSILLQLFGLIYLINHDWTPSDEYICVPNTFENFIVIVVRIGLQFYLGLFGYSSFSDIMKGLYRGIPLNIPANKFRVKVGFLVNVFVHLTLTLVSIFAIQNNNDVLELFGGALSIWFVAELDNNIVTPEEKMLIRKHIENWFEFNDEVIEFNKDNDLLSRFNSKEDGLKSCWYIIVYVFIFLIPILYNVFYCVFPGSIVKWFAVGISSVRVLVVEGFIMWFYWNTQKSFNL